MAAAGAGGMMAMDDAMLEAAAAELGLPPREMTPSGLGMMAPGVAPSAPSAPGVDVKTVKTWTALYPTYFNPDIPLSKGRRLAKEALAGCRDPWPQDVAEAAVRLGFANVALEPKRHPTDCFKVGRVRVMMKSPEGVPLLPHIPTKEKLIVEIAKVIPTLESRQRRIIELGARLEAQRKAAAAASAGVAKTVSKKDTKKKAATSKGRK